jgi:hypothetical protein
LAVRDGLFEAPQQLVDPATDGKSVLCKTHDFDDLAKIPKCLFQAATAIKLTAPMEPTD